MGSHKVVIVKELAEGGFGKVFLVRDPVSKFEFAMKQLLCQTSEQTKEAQHEVDMLLRFRNHPYIMNLVDYGSSTSKLHNNMKQTLLLFPLYTRGTLWDVIEKLDENQDWPFSESRCIAFMLDACRGLAAIHKAGFAHRDIKPHNIMITDDTTAIIMDLGSAAPAQVRVRGRQQSLLLEEEAATKASAPYRAPELTQVCRRP